MPTVLTSSQQTFVDITDQRKLSAYITSNLPKTQSEDPNVLPHTYAPSWASTNLVLTPVVFLDQTSIPLGSSGLTIQWKRKDGTAAETALTSGESVSGGILTVNQNKLASSSSGMITYICYISYYDSETHNTVNISADLTYTLVRNAENAKLAYITADTYVFKYDSDSALVGATQATLTGQVQGVTISKWQYKNGSGNWADYPTTADNASITGGTLVVKPTHSVFNDNVAQIKLVTSDADVYDTITITKLYDGAQGEPGTPGSAGSGGLSVILSNEAQTIPCSSGGAVAAATTVTIPFAAYEGIYARHGDYTWFRCSDLCQERDPRRSFCAHRHDPAHVLSFRAERDEELRLDQGQGRNKRRIRCCILRLCSQWNHRAESVRQPDTGDFGLSRRNGNLQCYLSVGKVQWRLLGQHLRCDRLDADGQRCGHREHPVLPLHHDL